MSSAPGSPGGAAEAPELRALRTEVNELRLRLHEAEHTLAAICSGEVEALVVQTADGPKVFGLTSADAASNQLRGEMLAQINEAVVAIDGDQCITFFNAAAERHFGCPVTDALGRRFGEVVRVLWRNDDEAAAVRRGLDSEGRWSGECVHQLVDGREIAVEVSLSALCDEAGRRNGTLAVVRDVTQRRAAELALNELAQRLQLAMRHAALGNWSWNLRTDDVSWSHDCYPIFGVAPGAVLSGATVTAELVHPDDRERIAVQRRAALEQHALYECEYRIIRRSDGAVRWVASIGRASYDAHGLPTLMIGTLADITERKHAEQALRDEAQRKDEFLALLAHELRNPLAPVTMTVGLLNARAADDALVARCRDIIARQTAQMARLLDDLLDVSRLSRGKVTLQRARVRLAEVIEVAVETSRPLVDQRSLQLVVEFSESARGLLLHADASRLVQVFSNLLNNASKYSHPGGRIELRAATEANQAVVRIHDEGIGISAEMLPRLFGLFVQSNEARRHAPGGLGIGLAVVHQLVQLHGGTLSASSDGIGRGSKFCVRLPLLLDERPDGVVAADRHQAVAEAPLRYRVLVVDDNVDAADTTAMLLESLGCEVSVVYAGESALREAERMRPEVVLLDLGMQGLDGYEVCRRLRAQPWGMAMTLVALSGWSQDEDRRRSAKAGFDLHLSKPVEPSVLIGAMRDARRLDD